MNSTIDIEFLRTLVIVTGFKPHPMKSAQAALLMIGLRTPTFCAADLPPEVCNGSKNLAGCATGALIAQGLLEVIGRVKSPNPNAKGRRLDLLQIPDAKRSTVLTWLERNGFSLPAPAPQMEIAL